MPESGQRSDAWFKRRLGKITGTRARVIMGRESGWLKLADTVRLEISTGEPVEAQFDNDAMRWGRDQEPNARAAYELVTGYDVDVPAFIDHPTLDYIGYSPDGIVLGVCGQEIKCPYNPVIHQATLAHGMPAHHIPQIQHGLWNTGLPYFDFISFDPRHPDPRSQLFIQSIPRDENYIERLAVRAVHFMELVHNGTTHATEDNPTDLLAQIPHF